MKLLLLPELEFGDDRVLEGAGGKKDGKVGKALFEVALGLAVNNEVAPEPEMTLDEAEDTA